MLSLLSYNKRPIDIGDTVYQMTNFRQGTPVLITLKIVEIIENKGPVQIMVEGTQSIEPGKIVRYLAAPENVHTDPLELIETWIKNYEHEFNVKIPTFIYRLYTMYQERGGLVDPNTIAKFKPLDTETTL